MAAIDEEIVTWSIVSVNFNDSIKSFSNYLVLARFQRVTVKLVLTSTE